jgi:hypothetical protein
MEIQTFRPIQSSIVQDMDFVIDSVQFQLGHSNVSTNFIHKNIISRL